MDTRRMSIRREIGFAIVGVALLCVLALNACGGGAEGAAGPAFVADMREVEEAEEEAAVEEAPAEEEEAEYAFATPMAAPSAETSEEEDFTGGGALQSDLVAALPQDRMIVKNGDMDLLVEDTARAIDQVTQVAVDNGGYVLSSQSWMVGETRAATIVIAVRADQFETAMRRLRAIAMEVLFETSSGEDVTSEYVDLESRLRNLEATRDRIRTFLDRATTVEEALEVNAQLADIEAEIEQVRGRMTYLSGRSAFSTITVDLSMPGPTPTPTPTPTVTPTPTPTSTPTPTDTPTPWAPGRTIRAAAQTQGALLRWLVEAGIWLVVMLGPYVLVGLLILLGIRALLRRRRAGISKPPPDASAKED